jgi:hypothetical protein
MLGASQNNNASDKNSEMNSVDAGGASQPVIHDSLAMQLEGRLTLDIA